MLGQYLKMDMITSFHTPTSCLTITLPFNAVKRN